MNITEKDIGVVFRDFYGDIWKVISTDPAAGMNMSLMMKDLQRLLKKKNM